MDKVVRVSKQAIDTLKQQFQSEEIVLVGYSGGGAIAALVAARRADVADLISVAGNLDIGYGFSITLLLHYANHSIRFIMQKTLSQLGSAIFTA